MDVAAQLARYEAINPEQEEGLLTCLIEAGWEPGCWLRPSPELLISATQPEMMAFLAELSKRQGFQRQSVDDPFPSGRDHEPVDGEEPCYIVLSQRCDVVGLLKNEPLIELASATFCADLNRIKTAWKNSPREFPLDPGATQTHMVDLRYRYFISKLDLAELEPRQALPQDTPQLQVRTRFGLRTAQPYTRAAVPDRLVAAVVSPLAKLVIADADANRLFTEWALFHGGSPEAKPGVHAIYRCAVDDNLSDAEQAARDDATQQAAEDAFEKLIEALPELAKAELDLDDDRRTRCIDEREHTIAAWRLSWKLEWDAVSFGGDPEAAIPAR
jgi:hypothetical protein